MKLNSQHGYGYDLCRSSLVPSSSWFVHFYSKTGILHPNQCFNLQVENLQLLKKGVQLFKS